MHLVCSNITHHVSGVLLIFVDEGLFTPRVGEAIMANNVLAAPKALRYLRRPPQTLVLNADFQPISITSASRSIALCQVNKAAVLEHSGLQLRSEKETIAAPSVIVLSTYIKVGREAQKRVRDTATRYEILRRDAFECQYCGAPATTLDHVFPISKGGKWTWDNMVAACWPCNNKKGSKLLSSADLGMSLRRPARKPTSGEHITLRHTVDEATSPLAYRRTWRKYLLPNSTAM